MSGEWLFTLITYLLHDWSGQSGVGVTGVSNCNRHFNVFPIIVFSEFSSSNYLVRPIHNRWNVRNYSSVFLPHRITPSFENMTWSKTFVYALAFLGAVGVAACYSADILDDVAERLATAQGLAKESAIANTLVTLVVVMFCLGGVANVVECRKRGMMLTMGRSAGRNDRVSWLEASVLPVSDPDRGARYVAARDAMFEFAKTWTLPKPNPNHQYQFLLATVEVMERQVEIAYHWIQLKITDVEDRLTARIDALETQMGARFDALETRVDALETNVAARFEALETNVAARFEHQNMMMVVLFQHLDIPVPAAQP
ncbi:uncharacterized protein LOC129600075 [Paramacrobiotus metropolitanus]|uniref:uncharacterized protein LOC129600075 n=1 Tax=Paramacrobiotus metropolitanus TaxID=2943436 RepID=UPI0024460EDE|nr:uncharacterized protein LOC129600075 [Paramacrobiotus metropolitanus]XP_055354442.1 uncharacterized protein LOC129600075 [Paramacrobiotus metropolitanus]